ncbi:glycosyltransferase family 2 protein [Paraburkholderia lacunae]|uniref:Glycosyltransferase n=1 Tax=Paraburkholderia lacunae TaxID=2211104 RepID=A0A370NDM1_9BURK|nr:glycosyltransferase [Paraburkholderia lacunae]RDK03665.1 glycosyltransferase [Paraburkholderia lacunae]
MNLMTTPGALFTRHTTQDATQDAHRSAARFAVCVTTMNRTGTLAACLDSLSRCVPRAACIVVSDDSPDPLTREANAAVVARHPGVVYLQGPRRGVCANRNHAVKACLAQTAPCDYVSFVDDDIQVEPDFFASADVYYASLVPTRRRWTILTGGTSTGGGAYECRPVRLSFAGYFMEGDRPQCVNIHAAVFPLALFERDGWDENIFFGTEDAELSLRALRRGYVIDLAPHVRTRDTMPGAGVLNGTDAGARYGLTRYQVNCEAARLYIGVKRYRVIEPDALRCVAFLAMYVGHLLVYLARRRALSKFVPIVRISNVWRASAAR